VTSLRRTFTVVNRLGMHARAATALARVAGNFDADVRVHKDGQSARSTSVIELLLLCGQPGTELEVSAEGTDAQAAIDAIGALIADRFGENE
jgi:phosphotransferase system HPr (HPr) family protein